MGFLDKRNFEGNIIGNRIIWEGEGEVAWLEPYGCNALRFRSSKNLRIDEKLNWTLLEPNDDYEVDIKTDQSKATIKNGDISAEINGDGVVTYFNRSGDVILSEYWQDLRVGCVPMRKAREFKTISSDAFAIDLFFHAQKGEHFYGMGQDTHGHFDLKGSTVDLMQKNSKCSIPFVYSSKGYGFLWNNPAIGRAEFVENHSLWHAKAARQIDYIVIAGSSPAEIMERYTNLSGRAPILPEWAAGFWQSKLRYTNQHELLEVAREHKRRDLPMSVIVADYFHWTQQGEWKFDPEHWPDPEAMTQELAEMGIRLMVSIWPTVDSRSENYKYMVDRNMTVRAESGLSVFLSFLGYETFYDATHPKAREFVWSKVKENYYDKGIKLFWLDESEPEFRPYDYENVRYFLGNGLEVSNIYPFMYAKTFYDGMLSAGEDTVVNLIRCAWIGSQRFGVVLWSGDIDSSFDSLSRQIKAGLNVAMSGIPWWTTDIGGFLHGDPKDPEFRELIIRWFQFGVFCPVFRLHGYRLPYKDADYNDPNAFCNSGSDNEVWSFGEEAYEIIKELLCLRERLVPYIMEQMKIASETGAPVMRPLLFDFHEDENVYDIGDQYMFGPDLLVAPVIEMNSKRRKVYLPTGSSWTNAKSAEIIEGGQLIEVEAELDTIPLFFRGDSRLPIYDLS